MKYVLLVLVIFTPTTYSSSDKKECIRWSWTGDVYERKVVCLEWRKKEDKK